MATSSLALSLEQPASDAEAMLPVNGFFTTQTTDLAACLGALRVPIRSFRSVREAGSPYPVVHYTFAAGDQSGAIECATVDWAWRHREEFARTQGPANPLVLMRAAIDSLQWIVGVHHGRVRIDRAATLIGRFFQTDDWNVAACLRASGHQIARMENGVCYFMLPVNDPTLARLLDCYGDYQSGRGDISHMRAALEVRRTLIRTVKSKALRTEVRHTHGDPLNGGREAYIYEDAPESVRRDVLTMLRS